MHHTDTASEWIERWSHLVPAGAPVLDVACGMGRHVRWFAQRGHPVTGVDRAPQAAQAAAAWGEALCADIENAPWPLAGREFGAVVVTNYLWRALLYETFADGNQTVGKPSRPDFLLQPGELLRACTDLRVVAYEDGYLGAPERFVQRIAAVRTEGGVPSDAPARHLLRPPCAD